MPRTVALTILVSCLFLLAVPTVYSGADDLSTIDMPGFLDSTSFLRGALALPASSKPDLGVEKTVLATNKIVSLRDISRKRQPRMRFSGDDASALLETRESVRIEARGWWVGCGQGEIESYDGNEDAAQLWLDLRSKTTQGRYMPQARRNLVSASWLGVGRRFPVRMGGVRSDLMLIFRSITADDYWAGVATGDYENDVFTGMLKTVVSESWKFRCPGEGWSLDAEAHVDLGRRGRARVAAEGLMGRVTWDAMTFEDRYIQSPTVFTDPEGYLRDTGGISGVWSRQRLSLRINPRYQLDIAVPGTPDLLLGITAQKGNTSTPYLGGAWKYRRDSGLVYLKYYPSQQRYEAGALGRGWHARLSSDSLSVSSAKSAEASVSVSLSAF